MKNVRWHKMVWSIRIYIALDFSSRPLLLQGEDTNGNGVPRKLSSLSRAAMINRDRIFKFNFAINSRSFRIRNAAGEAIFSLGINCMCVMEIPKASLTSALSLCERHSYGAREILENYFHPSLCNNARLPRLVTDFVRRIHLACWLSNLPQFAERRRRDESNALRQS